MKLAVVVVLGGFLAEGVAADSETCVQTRCPVEQTCMQVFGANRFFCLPDLLLRLSEKQTASTVASKTPSKRSLLFHASKRALLFHASKRSTFFHASKRDMLFHASK